MPAPRHGVMRDVLAMVIIAIACPAAVFGGSMAGCLGQGFSTSCAMNAVYISPVLLIAAGILAGLSTRGWTGLFIVYVGGVIGMFSILGLTIASGRNVLVDPIAAVIATIWFMTPVTIGYGVGRLVAHRREARGRASRTRPGGRRTA